jgi:polysaccharide export outer membrane protein
MRTKWLIGIHVIGGALVAICTAALLGCDHTQLVSPGPGMPGEEIATAPGMEGMAQTPAGAMPPAGMPGQGVPGAMGPGPMAPGPIAALGTGPGAPGEPGCGGGGRPYCTNLPNEKCKFVQPDYVIEPPDILILDAIRAIPLPPYKISPLDSLLVQVTNSLPNEPISGIYVVDPDGTLNLGPSYAAVQVVGMTIPEARKAIEKELEPILKNPRVSLSLGRSRATQQIRGQHLVRPDGRVGLGIYGSVLVAGMTIPQAKTAIEHHLSYFLQRPEIAVDILAYNSKVFYVIFDGALNGVQVLRLPSTGNDNVLDAIAQVNGLVGVSDKHKMWIARPGPPGAKCDQILPIDWMAISTRGRTETNYQVLPGDRIYVESDHLVRFDTFLGRLYAPITRTFGLLLLGVGTVRELHDGVSVSGSGGGGNGR